MAAGRGWGGRAAWSGAARRLGPVHAGWCCLLDPPDMEKSGGYGMDREFCARFDLDNVPGSVTPPSQRGLIYSPRTHCGPLVVVASTLSDISVSPSSTTPTSLQLSLPVPAHLLAIYEGPQADTICICLAVV